MSWFLAYFNKHRPKRYPDTHKRCMECGEIILWEDDCSHGHFKQIGREMRAKAAKSLSFEEKTKPRRKPCQESSGSSSSEQRSLLG